ncbi:MAG: hypothetical protein AAF479_15250 [Pseudomonadota bacterium]
MPRLTLILLGLGVLAACSSTSPEFKASKAADEAKFTQCIQQAGVSGALRRERKVTDTSITSSLLPGNGVSQEQADLVNTCMRE